MASSDSSEKAYGAELYLRCINTSGEISVRLPSSISKVAPLKIQIEAVLNSRPICPLSNDPNDVETLTPAHFLVGSSLVAVPDPDYTEIPMNRLSRWQLVQRMNQHF
ncbi:integrase catalytic domain-containing protein [Trichonephila clavipes]|nr:integrase catalytic domain-containing protein [Trichonephila clavipes]